LRFGALAHSTQPWLAPSRGRGTPKRGYLNKEILNERDSCYTSLAVQPGTAMTVEEMGPVTARWGPFRVRPKESPHATDTLPRHLLYNFLKQRIDNPALRIIELAGEIIGVGRKENLSLVECRWSDETKELAEFFFKS
jgi:hypothetical protein